MSWSYTLVSPLSAKDQVRLLIGDTDLTDPLLADEEIGTVLAVEGTNLYRAAAQCCEDIASKYARQADKSISRGFFLLASQQAKAYQDRAKRLRGLMSRAGLTPYAGGISIADKTTQDGNPDRVAPMFTRDMLTAPGTSTGALPNIDTNVLNALGLG